ncbi:MAG: response regulator transcription factor [Planctomycetota bacterium]
MTVANKQLEHQYSILVVEDNPTTSRMLVLFLKDAGFNVTCADDGRKAMNCFDQGQFDLVLLDLMLPDTDGMSVCTSIRSRSRIPIVMLTAKSTEDDIVTGLESGADDYVCKPFRSRELLARIRRCLRDCRRGSSDAKSRDSVDGLIKAGAIEVDLDRREVRVADNSVKLTKSEFAILAAFVENPGRVFTRSQLVSRVFGPNYDGFDRSIDTHVWNLRKKLGEPKGNPRYILSEPGVGYRLNDQHAI